MIVVCPKCQKALRLKSTGTSRTVLTLRCPSCSIKFKAQVEAGENLRVLIAHDDPEICQQIIQQFKLLQILPSVCRNAQQLSQQLESGSEMVLLLDVAFSGTFPFALIETVKSAVTAEQHKIVLLPSVYNKTAYKKKPTSLYGADAYLELHHIGDRLLALIAELFPVYQKQVEVALLEITATYAGERALQQTDLLSQAEELARLLAADIAFYHQERLQRGLRNGGLKQLFCSELAEGRRLLEERLPAAAQLDQDLIQLAFEDVCEKYRMSGVDAV